MEAMSMPIGEENVLQAVDAIEFVQVGWRHGSQMRRSNPCAFCVPIYEARPLPVAVETFYREGESAVAQEEGT